MRSVLFRALFGLAAFCALLSFIVAPPWGARLGSLAIICAVLSVLVWRGWRPSSQEGLPPESSVLDEVGLLEATAGISRCCAGAASFDDALKGVGQVFAQELGAHKLRVLRISRTAGEYQGEPLLDLCVPRRPANAASFGASSRRALRERGIVSDEQQGHALPVLVAGEVVALIEFDALELCSAPATRLTLLELARRELAVLATSRRATAPPPAGHRLDVHGGPNPNIDFLEAINADRQVALFVVEPETLHVVAMSRRAERDFALRRRRVLGLPLSTAFSASLVPLLAGAVAEAANSGRAVECNVHWSTPRGQRGANVSLSMVRYDDGSPRWCVAMARDLKWDARSGGERRVMPRHGSLNVDLEQAAPKALPRPAAAISRLQDQE